MRSVRRRFLAGIAVLLPTVVTVWILWKIIAFLDGILDPLARRLLGFSNAATQILTPVLGILTVFLLIVLAGSFAGNFLGRKLLELFEAIVHRVPVAGRIYVSVKQIMDVFVVQKLEAFQSVVFFQYPRQGLWALGLISRETPASLLDPGGERAYNVFVPTSPNPTSGFVLLVPESELRFSPLSVEEAIKLVISGGAYVPPRLVADATSPAADARMRHEPR